MAVEVWSFQNTIPAGTAKATPVKLSMKLPPREIERIDILVPAGPNGLMGFQLGMAGAQVFPANAGNWFVKSAVNFSWDLQGQPNSGAWQLFGYNTGQYDHTVYVDFLVALPTDPYAAAVAPAPNVVGNQIAG